MQPSDQMISQVFKYLTTASPVHTFVSTDDKVMTRKNFCPATTQKSED